MLMPHPAVLRTLVEEYEAATAAGTPQAGARAQDLAYTLCVSTGTRDVGSALRTAHRWLTAAAAADAAGRPHTEAAGRPHTEAAGRPHTEGDPHVYA